LFAVAAALLVSLVSAWGSNGWGGNCSSGIYSQDCAAGYNYCGTNAPAPSQQSQNFSACWCQYIEAGPADGSPPCCGYGAPTPVNWLASYPGSTNPAKWNSYCASKYPCSNKPGGFCDTTAKLCTLTCPAEIVDETAAAEMPISSAVALIFLAFFFGIVLSYVVYKFRKSHTKYNQTETAQALSESSHQSAEDSHLGERPLNVAPLSEQV